MLHNPEHARKVTPVVTGSRFEMVKAFGISPTINGNPARITGYSNRFATVTDSVTGLSAEWSWEAVKLTMEHGGAFKS